MARGVRILIAAVACLLLVAVGAAAAVYVGFVSVIRDPHRLVQDVQFAYADHAVSLHRLPGNMFVGWPDDDAQLEVICRSGHRVSAGYATTGASPSFKISMLDCDGSRRVIPVR